ncbi:MAG: MBL fold metallo-hydrolase [Nanobdellota archaeon]
MVMILVKQCKVGPLRTNAYVLCSQDTADCAIIDPGTANENELQHLKKLCTGNCNAILLTHNHFDHIMGACHFFVNCYLHQKDIDSLETSSLLEQRFADYEITLPSSIHPFNSTITIGSTTFVVIHTPGHSQGGISLYNEKERLLFSGDTLFKGTCGRTDLPGSDSLAMKQSLKKLLELPDDTMVYPGHGQPTTIGDEREWVEEFIRHKDY